MNVMVQAATLRRGASWRGALFVAGTCIGGGMLAMPIQTAEAGFFLASLVLFLTWGFMTLTGLLLVEVSGWFKKGAHFSSMADALLGRVGKNVSLVVYLFMNCVSLVAYTSGGAILLDQWGSALFGISLGYPLCCILFTLFFGCIVSLGISFVGRVNAWMTFVMGAIFCGLVIMGIYALKPDYLAFRAVWLQGLNSFPLIIAAFSYQMIVPSLCSYLDYDVKQLRKAIVLGTSLPFFIYLLWLLLIHGIIPCEGASGLKAALANKAMIVEPLKIHFKGKMLFLLIDLFAFLALSTSYLGLSIALFDFVRDRFKEVLKRVGNNRVTVFSLVPSLMLAIFFPHALIDFLDISGGFGDALLSGLIPVGMAWVGRYRMKLTDGYQLGGGKGTLMFAGSFALFIFIFQWVKLVWNM